ncbi:hypothetical protein BFN01_07230 [Microbacterium sp. AR7-10]|nr:hypothetical protein BFN01_07230 [Microbacterium sp. AR7-10]
MATRDAAQALARAFRLRASFTHRATLPRSRVLIDWTGDTRDNVLADGQRPLQDTPERPIGVGFGCVLFVETLQSLQL